VCHCITCHQQLKTIEAWQQMCFYIIAPNALLSFKLFVNVFYHFGKESSCSCCRVKYLYFVNFLLLFCLVFNFNFVLLLSASPCGKSNSVFRISSTARTIKFTTGCGVYQTPLALRKFRVVFAQERFRKNG
jgi:hypothetical protein